MDGFTAAAAGAAFFTGVSGSVHCAAMCGPLACAPLPRESHGRARAIAGWQGGRLAGYAAAGAVFGAAGGAVLERFPLLQRAAPWLVVLGLVLTGLEVFGKLGALPGLRAVTSAAMRASARLSPGLRAGAFGALTPLLPCGLLYGVFLSAAGAGGALEGAALMAAFALGAVLPLALVQGFGSRLTVSPKWRTAVLLVAAGVLAWRAWHADAASPPPCH